MDYCICYFTSINVILLVTNHLEKAIKEAISSSNDDEINLESYNWIINRHNQLINGILNDLINRI